MFGKTQPAGILEIFTNKEATNTLMSDLFKEKKVKKLLEAIFGESKDTDVIENRKRAYLFTLRDMVAFFVEERKQLILKIFYKKEKLKRTELAGGATKSEKILNRLIPAVLQRLNEQERSEILSELSRMHPQPHQKDLVQLKDKFEKRYKVDEKIRGTFAQTLNYPPLKRRGSN